MNKQPVKMPEVFCTATSTPFGGGPKSYFLTIRDGEELIRLEIKWNSQQRSVTADVVVPHEYNYPDYDSDEDEDEEYWYGEDEDEDEEELTEN